MGALLLYTLAPLGMALGVYFGVEPVMNITKFFLPGFGIVIILLVAGCISDEEQLAKLKVSAATQNKFRKRFLGLSTLTTSVILAAAGWYITAAIWLVQFGAMVAYIEKARKYKEENSET